MATLHTPWCRFLSMTLSFRDSTGRGRNLAGRVPSPSRKRLVRKRFAPKAFAGHDSRVARHASPDLQAENLTGKSLHVLLISVPIQVPVMLSVGRVCNRTRPLVPGDRSAKPGANPLAQSQCRKCRMLVNTIAIPNRSAAAITLGSFTEPPG